MLSTLVRHKDSDSVVTFQHTCFVLLKGLGKTIAVIGNVMLLLFKLLLLLLLIILMTSAVIVVSLQYV